VSGLVGIARMAAASPLLAAKQRVEYFHLPARSFLSRCDNPRLPFSWTINPYRGCEFGCKYCYARYAHEFMELREPSNDGVLCSMKMRGGMFVLGGIAAAHMPANEAQAQIHPGIACF
jgi:hypothetical protein